MPTQPWKEVEDAGMLPYEMNYWIPFEGTVLEEEGADYGYA